MSVQEIVNENTQTEETVGALEKSLQEGIDQEEGLSEGVNEGISLPEDNKEEFVVEVEDKKLTVEDPDSGPNWVRDLRNRYKEIVRKNKELESKLAEYSSSSGSDSYDSEGIAGPGPKPTLESCDYDADKYQLVYEEWHARKSKYDSYAEKVRSQARAEQESWTTALELYQQSKNNLPLKDFDLAEEAFVSKFSKVHQGIVVKACKNPALVVYVLGKNKEKAEQLSRHEDPLKFAFALADFERNLKLTRKTAPKSQPEEAITGSGGSYHGIGQDIDSMVEEALRTGDATRLVRARTAKKRQTK